MSTKDYITTLPDMEDIVLKNIQRAATTPSKRSKGLPLVARTSLASVREFCSLSLYTPTFDKEPK